MTDLIGTIWQSNADRTRYVRVMEAGPQAAFVAACTEQGKVWYTLGRGEMRARMTKVALVGDGTRLSRYTRVEVQS